MFQYPDIDPIAFGFGPVQVRWYGLMYLVGFLAAWLGMRSRAKLAWSRIQPEHVDDLVFYGALGAIVGGRVGYMLVYALNELISDPLSLFAVWQGGMSFHGGLTGVLIAMALYARRIRQPFLVVTDFIAPWTAPGFFFVRIGNFINNELWGKPTSADAPWAVIVEGEARHPSQLYEASLEGLVLFVILWTYSRTPRPAKAVSGLFLIGYGAFRILVEFVRVPDEQLGYLALGWITMGQVLSAPMVIAGVILFVLAHRSKEASTAAEGSRSNGRAAIPKKAS